MTSKELNEILNKTRRTPDISLTPKQVEEVEKDLEELEELKKIMGTPIQEIMKQIKILEEIRYYFKVFDYGEKFQNRYAIRIGANPAGYIYPINKNTYDRWSRWLENDI